ncbi:MAG: hypothetical protein AB7R90_19400 [Reyranellaceae bacterium]
MARREDGFAFFGRVWRADIELQSCSLAARGLWAQLLTIMDEAEPRGHLLVRGTPPTIEQVARLGGCTPAEARRCLEELLRQGAASRTAEGVVFSRRMAAEGARSAVNRANVARRYESDTNGGSETGTNGVTNGATNRVTKGATKPATKPATKSPSPLHPPSPSESFSESSSSASTSLRKSLRARGFGEGEGQQNQAVAALRAGGFRVSQGGAGGVRIGVGNDLGSGAKPAVEADQIQAYERVKKLLETEYGNSPVTAMQILWAAYDAADPEHERSLQLVREISKRHRCGLYPERPLQARQTVRA